MIVLVCRECGILLRCYFSPCEWCRFQFSKKCLLIFLLEEIQFDICQSCYEPRESSEKLKEAIAKFFGGASTSLMTVPKMPKAIEPANLILKDFESNTSNDLSRVHARQAKNALKSNKERKHARFIKAVRLK